MVGHNLGEVETCCKTEDPDLQSRWAITRRSGTKWRSRKRRGHSSACCRNENRRRREALPKLAGVEEESENRCPVAVAGEADQCRRRRWPNQRRRRIRRKAALQNLLQNRRRRFCTQEIGKRIPDPGLATGIDAREVKDHQTPIWFG
ncbi:hypothetical protein AAC387_Pa07g1690 [Persea americana]